MAEEQHDSGDEAKSVNLEDAVVVFDDLKFDGIAGTISFFSTLYYWSDAYNTILLIGT